MKRCIKCNRIMFAGGKDKDGNPVCGGCMLRERKHNITTTVSHTTWVFTTTSG